MFHRPALRACVWIKKANFVCLTLGFCVLHAPVAAAARLHPAGIKKKEYADVDVRWKVRTYFMYANDIMGICDGPAAEHPDYLMWEQKTEEWLQNVTDTNSNMYINLLFWHGPSVISKLFWHGIF